MRMVIEKHLGGGEYERVGIADVDVPPGPGNPVPPAFEALDVTEVADYKVYPEGAEQSPGFYRLTMDGTIMEIEHPTP
jgi:hypothetical protein